MRAGWGVVVAIVGALAVRVARAEPPRRAHAIDRERTLLLAGHLGVQLAVGMHASPDDSAALDWGATRFTIEAGEVEATALATVLAECTCARVGRVARARPWDVHAFAPRLPPRVGDRELVLVAYVGNVTGAVELVRFYVDAGGFDDVGEWGALAERIAATLTPLHDAALPTRPLGVAASELATGWTVAADAQWFVLPADRDATCVVHAAELDAQAIADPRTALWVDGELFGTTVYWSVWRDRGGQHTETMIGARTWGTFHVFCTAPHYAELAELRATVETRFAR